jgi:hypothetical protein
VSGTLLADYDVCTYLFPFHVFLPPLLSRVKSLDFNLSKIKF